MPGPGEPSGGGAGRERRKAPPAVRLATDCFGVTLTFLGLVAAGIAVGAGAAPPGEVLFRVVLGVAAGAGGLFAASGHLLVAADTARDMGWPVGTPWQR